MQGQEHEQLSARRPTTARGVPCREAGPVPKGSRARDWLEAELVTGWSVDLSIQILQLSLLNVSYSVFSPYLGQMIFLCSSGCFAASLGLPICRPSSPSLSEGLKGGC